MNTGYGQHLSFPFQIDTNGRTAAVTTLDDHIRDELIQLLLTNPGERAFLPEFGGGLRRLVFEPVGEATQGMTKSMITQAISTWLGHRIELEALSVEVADTTIEVELKYRIAGTEDSRVMRFQRKGELG
jgi:phage baseplate assembly protein W